MIKAGEYKATATITTTDVAGIFVNSSRSRLGWKVDYWGKVYWQSVLDECVATNPSAAGTHWFTQSCSNDIPCYRNNQQEVYNDVRGEYINWDFGSSSQSTTVSHWISLHGQNDGLWNLQWTYSDAGEFNSFLGGSITACGC